MQQIDVVTTAIRRPEILELAYRSYFNGGIRGLPQVRVILNIDPIGTGDVNEIIEIASRYASEVVVRQPDESNFAAAINWAWSHVKSEYFLHLEDDWLLSRPIDFCDWMGSLQGEAYLQAVLIRKRSRKVASPYSFRANLAKKAVIAKVGEIPLDHNPEKFAKSQLAQDVSIDFGPERQLYDMGRKWAKAQCARKADGSNKLRIDKETLNNGWFGNRNSGFWGPIDYRRSRLIWLSKLKQYEFI